MGMVSEFDNTTLRFHISCKIVGEGWRHNLHDVVPLRISWKWNVSSESMHVAEFKLAKSFKRSRIARKFSFDWFAQFRHLRRVPIRSAILWQLICLLSPDIIQTLNLTSAKPFSLWSLISKHIFQMRLWDQSNAQIVHMTKYIDLRL